MKSLLKTLGIIVLAAVMVFAMAGCKSGGGDDDPNDPSSPNYQGGSSNGGQGDPNNTQEPPPPPLPVNAQAPEIRTHPASTIYPTLIAEPEPLWVMAVSLDGGTLTYKWYKNLTDSYVGAQLVSTDPSYLPENGVKSLAYYYVEVTNTIPDNEDGGEKSASAKSNTAYVGFAITPLKITGISGKNKVYDGTDAAELNGSPVLALVSPGAPISGASLVAGTAKFKQVNVGTGIGITLVGWYLEGAKVEDYFLNIPTDLTANITKAPGAAITAVTANGTPTNNSLTVNEITLESGQSVEYAISKAANGTGLSAYQAGTSFTGLSAFTDYYVYARSVANDNYETGEATASAAIKTANPKVYFETYGGTAIEASTVVKGQALLKSQILSGGDPEKDGYIFDYWFRDVEFTTPYDFQHTSNIINDNLTIYARFISNAEITMMRNSKNMEWIKTGPAMLGQLANTRVMVTGYWMGKYEVTQDQWTEIMFTNPSFFKSPVQGEPNTPGRLPVDSVTYFDALVYCNKLSIQEGLSPAYKINNSVYPDEWGTVPVEVYLRQHDNLGNDGGNDTLWPGVINVGPGGKTHPDSINLAAWDAVEIVHGSNGYRLPTKDQWENACRAGTTTVYSTGDEVSDNTGWYTANSSEKTHRVGQKPANGNQYGLYDMHGNVREWIWQSSSERLTGVFSFQNYWTYIITWWSALTCGGSWRQDAVSMLVNSYSVPPVVNRENYYSTNDLIIPRGIEGRNFVGLRLVRP